MTNGCAPTDARHVFRVVAHDRVRGRQAADSRHASDLSGNSVAREERSVDLTWSGLAQTESRQKPEWLGRLEAEQSQQQQVQYDALMTGPLMWIGTALVSGLALSVPIYLIAQIVALIRLRDGWRIAAAVPAVPMALVLLYTVVAFIQGSNLFPLVLLFTSPPALLYLLGLLVLRRFRRVPPAFRAAR